MIDFIYKLNNLLSFWQVGTTRTLQELSVQMEMALPQIIQNLSEVLGVELDVTASLSFDEAMEAFLILGRQHREEIEAHERKLDKAKEMVAILYEQLAPRIVKMQLEKKWYQAFRTLSYFAGRHENQLGNQLRINICSEIVRSAIRCSVNLQEVAYWLEKGIMAALETQNVESLEEGFDLLDAYADFFLKEPTGRGEKIVLKLLKILEAKAYQFNKSDRYKEAVKDIFSMVQ